MNNEIKEILEYLKDKNDYIEDFGISYKRIHIDNGDLKTLLDYITNLQQENETRQQDINNLTYQLAKIKQENERLKEYYELMVQFNEKNLDRFCDYKSRCEKAIEYIENPRHEMSVLTYQNLLNILQNGSDDN